MIRESLFALLLSLVPPALSQEPPEAPPSPDVELQESPAEPVQADAAPLAEPAATRPLPAMRFVSSIAKDELLSILKSEPALAGLDPDLAGSPLTLVVTHTLRPTAGGQAAGFVSAILSGSTLGLIPVVSNEHLVLKYEILLNGKSITSHAYERTATRAQNLWAAGNDGHNGLGKAGMEWARATAAEAAAGLTADSRLRAVQEEIDFYFAAPATSGSADPAGTP